MRWALTIRRRLQKHLQCCCSSLRLGWGDNICIEEWRSLHIGVFFAGARVDLWNFRRLSISSPRSPGAKLGTRASWNKTWCKWCGETFPFFPPNLRRWSEDIKVCFVISHGIAGAFDVLRKLREAQESYTSQPLKRVRPPISFMPNLWKHIFNYILSCSRTHEKPEIVGKQQFLSKSKNTLVCHENPSLARWQGFHLLSAALTFEIIYEKLLMNCCFRQKFFLVSSVVCLILQPVTVKYHSLTCFINQMVGSASVDILPLATAASIAPVIFSKKMAMARFTRIFV